jgi:hypothetical protein
MKRTAKDSLAGSTEFGRRSAEFREPLVRHHATFDDRLGRRPEQLTDRWCQQNRTEPYRYSGQRVAFEHIFQQCHRRSLCASGGAMFARIVELERLQVRCRSLSYRQQLDQRPIRVLKHRFIP